MNSRFCLCLLLLLLPLLSSCAKLAPKVVGEPVSQEFADELAHGWFASVAENRSVQGLARFEMVTPERSMKGNQVLLVEKPDRLRSEILNMFGSPLLLLAANGEKMNVHLSFENHFYTGKANAKNLGRFVRLPLQLKDLVSVLLYQPPMMNAQSEVAFALKDGGWLLEWHNPPHRQKLYFDPEKRLVEASYYDADGLFLRVDYGKFAADTGYPNRFKINLPRQETTVDLEFSDLEVNREMKPGIFQLAVPDGAKIFSLDEEI